MGRVKRYYELPVCSTNSVTDATKLFQYGNTVTLYFDYFIDDAPKRSGIRFIGVIATRTYNERFGSTLSAYDRLTEFIDSPWIDEIKQSVHQRHHDELRSFHHFGIYLDSDGSFEVLSTDFEILPEESGSWESLQATTTS